MCCLPKLTINNFSLLNVKSSKKERDASPIWKLEIRSQWRDLQTKNIYMYNLKHLKWCCAAPPVLLKGMKNAHMIWLTLFVNSLHLWKMCIGWWLSIHVRSISEDYELWNWWMNVHDNINKGQQFFTFSPELIVHIFVSFCRCPLSSCYHLSF